MAAQLREPETFETIIERERERLNRERDKTLEKRNQIDQQLHAIERELQAIEAYERAKQGKLQLAPRRTSTPRAPRGRRREMKTKVLELLKDKPDGLFSNQISDALNVADKKDKQAVANLLVAMKKNGEIAQEAKRGPYALP